MICASYNEIVHCIYYSKTFIRKNFLYKQQINNIFLLILICLSGVAAELYYVRGGVVNTYAMGFTVPVPASIADLDFSWQSLTGHPVSKLPTLSRELHLINKMAFPFATTRQHDNFHVFFFSSTTSLPSGRLEFSLTHWLQLITFYRAQVVEKKGGGGGGRKKGSRAFYPQSSCGTLYTRCAQQLLPRENQVLSKGFCRRKNII